MQSDKLGINLTENWETCIILVEEKKKNTDGGERERRIRAKVNPIISQGQHSFCFQVCTSQDGKKRKEMDRKIIEKGDNGC